MTLTKSSYPSWNVGLITTKLSLSCHMSFHNLNSFFAKKGLLSSECSVSNDLDKLSFSVSSPFRWRGFLLTRSYQLTTPQISSLTTRIVCARNEKSCDNKKASGECEISNGAVCQHYPWRSCRDSRKQFNGNRHWSNVVERNIVQYTLVFIIAWLVFY